MRPKIWMAALAVPAVLAIFAGAACGGDDDDTATPTTSVATTAPTTSGAAGASATAAGDKIPEGAKEIDQDNLQFKPDKLTVKSGEKVYVKNSESALHTFDVNGKNLSGNMKKGDVYVWTAPTAGTYKVTCEFHPQMNATITVQ